MHLIKKIFNDKTSKSALTIGLIAIFLQVLIAAYPIIKPISLKSDLTLFYGIVIIELIIFPISLSLVFSYVLDKIKWLEKKSFLITFLVAFLFIITAVILGRLAWGLIIPREFFLFYKYLEILIIFIGLIGIPLIHLLGWSGGTVFSFVMIIGIFVTAFLVASLFSYTTYLATNKKKRFFRIILIAVLILYIGWGIFQAVNQAYLRRLSLEGKCPAGLNFFDCDSYTRPSSKESINSPTPIATIKESINSPTPIATISQPDERDCIPDELSETFSEDFFVGKSFMNMAISGEWGYLNSDHRLPIEWGLDWAGPDDDRPNSGEGGWYSEIKDGNLQLSLYGTTISDNAYTNFRFFKYKQKIFAIPVEYTSFIIGPTTNDIKEFFDNIVKPCWL